MDCTAATVGNLKLDDYVAAVTAIYARHDRNRSLWDVWCHAQHHAAAIAEEVRKGLLSPRNDKTLQEIADFSLWFFSMLAKLQEVPAEEAGKNYGEQSVIRISASASQLMWNRYPYVCPLCRLPSCACGPEHLRRKKAKGREHKRAIETRRLARESSNTMPASIDQWQEMIVSIYRERLKQLEVANIVLHLLEEMGEVSDALVRMYTYVGSIPSDEPRPRQIRLEDELADTLSLLFGLVGRLRMDIHDGTAKDAMRLSQILWQKYGSEAYKSFWCRHCKSTVCSCAIIFARSETQVQEILQALRIGLPTEKLGE